MTDCYDTILEWSCVTHFNTVFHTLVIPILFPLHFAHDQTKIKYHWKFFTIFEISRGGKCSFCLPSANARDQYQCFSALATPTNLLFTSVTSSSVTIEWDSIPTATSYDLMYSNNISIAFTTISVISNKETITGLTSGTVYYFKVVAVNGTLKSPESNLKAQKTSKLNGKVQTFISWSFGCSDGVYRS